MPNVTVRVIGDDELRRALRKLPQVAGDQIQTHALKQAARPTKEAAPKDIPVGPGRHGHLRDSLKIVKRKDERLPTVAVYPTKFTGLFMARGWRHRGGGIVPPPYPNFLEGAFDANLNKTHRIYSNEVRRELDRRWKR